MATTVTPEMAAAVKGRGYLRNVGTDCFSARVITVNGRVTTEQVRGLVEAADRYGEGMVTLTSRLTFEIPGIHYDNIEPFEKALAEVGLAVGGTGPRVRPVVSCKGTICHFGNIDTFELSERIHREFYEGYRPYKVPKKFKIGVGGCPNNCIKPTINDIGIVGANKPVYDTRLCRGCAKCKIMEACPIDCCEIIAGKLMVRKECLWCGRCIGKCPFGVVPEAENGMKVFVGGRWGKKTREGTQVNHFFTSQDEVCDFIENTILYYIENGEPGERLETTLDRLGFEDAVKRILAGEFKQRKEQILATAQ